MSESNDAKASPEGPAPAKGGKLVTILALVNFLGVLGLGGYFLYTQQHAAAQGKKTEEKAGDAHKRDGEHGGAAKEGAAHGEPKEEGHGEAKEGGHGAKEEGAHGEVGADEDNPVAGPLLALESMVTNLAEPDSDRYLKVVLQFRLTSEAARPEVESHLVPVRNQILIFLSSLTMEDTTGADNKRSIQKRVKRIANEAMPSSRITDVYFTEFVIQ